MLTLIYHDNLKISKFNIICEKVYPSGRNVHLYTFANGRDIFFSGSLSFFLYFSYIFDIYDFSYFTQILQKRFLFVFVNFRFKRFAEYEYTRDTLSDFPLIYDETQLTQLLSVIIQLVTHTHYTLFFSRVLKAFIYYLLLFM